MNKKAVLDLLQNVHVHMYIGFSTLDTVRFAIEKELLKRTGTGNFMLTDKGLDLLNGNIKWENI